MSNHIGYLLFVGGEPLVHRDLCAMVRYAAERGIHPMICTNGGLRPVDVLDVHFYPQAGVDGLGDSGSVMGDFEALDSTAALIDHAKKNGDTLGGVCEVVGRGLPVGLGSHVSWDRKLDARAPETPEDPAIAVGHFPGPLGTPQQLVRGHARAQHQGVAAPVEYDVRRSPQLQRGALRRLTPCQR